MFLIRLADGTELKLDSIRYLSFTPTSVTVHGFHQGLNQTEDEFPLEGTNRILTIHHDEDDD